MLLSFMRTWRATGLCCSNQQHQLLCKQQVRLMYAPLLLLLLMYKMVMSIHSEGGRHLKYSHRGLAEIMGGLLSLTALDDNY